MKSKRTGAIVLAATLLLAGCIADDPQTKNDPPIATGNVLEGTLTIYASPDYQASLDRAFDSIEIFYPQLSFEWTDQPTEADVVITDRLAKEQLSEFQDLTGVADELDVIDTLAIKNGGKVIGVPLFLHMDSFWYSYEITQTPDIVASLDDLPGSGQAPILVADNSDTLFWSVLAPQYLSNGGSASDLSNGTFLAKPMTAALERLALMRDNRCLTLSDYPQDRFIAGNVTFWAANSYEIAGIRNAMYARTIPFVPTLALKENEPVNLLLRADVIAVRTSTDPQLAAAFLKELYTRDRLISLVNYVKIPPATTITYGPHSILDDLAPIYEGLSSPELTLTKLPCLWSDDTYQTVVETVSGMMNGRLSVDEACRALTA